MLVKCRSGTQTALSPPSSAYFAAAMTISYLSRAPVPSSLPKNMRLKSMPFFTARAAVGRGFVASASQCFVTCSRHVSRDDAPNT